MLRLTKIARGRRGLVALLGGIVPLILAVVPVHAELESVYALPWPVCTGGTCQAETTVHVLLHADYAACVAMLTAAEFMPNTPLTVRGAPPGSVAVDTCDSLSSEDASVLAWAEWTPGGCVSNGSTQAIVNGRFPVWSATAGGSTTSQSCSTIDSSYTQTLSLVACPSTVFHITADIKGNANGTFQGGYSVNATGSCASAFDVLVVEGAPEQGLGSVVGCKIACPGPPNLDADVAAAPPTRTGGVSGAGALTATPAERQRSAGDSVASPSDAPACQRLAPCPS